MVLSVLDGGGREKPKGSSLLLLLPWVHLAAFPQTWRKKSLPISHSSAGKKERGWKGWPRRKNLPRGTPHSNAFGRRNSPNKSAPFVRLYLVGLCMQHGNLSLLRPIVTDSRREDCRRDFLSSPSHSNTHIPLLPFILTWKLWLPSSGGGGRGGGTAKLPPEPLTLPSTPTPICAG